MERAKQNVIRGSWFEAAMFDEEGETAEKNDLTEGVNPAAASSVRLAQRVPLPQFSSGGEFLDSRLSKWFMRLTFLSLLSWIFKEP